MASKLTEDEVAIVQTEIDRMSHGYEKPLNSIVVERISPLYEALGFESRGALTEKLRQSPYSTLLTAVRNVAGESNLSVSALTLIDEVLTLYQGEAEKPFVNGVIADRLLLRGATGDNVAEAFGYSDQEFAEGLRHRPFTTLLTMLIFASNAIA